MTWPSQSIGILADGGSMDIQTGPFGTQLKASDYVSSGTPVINVRNIGYSDLRPEKLEFVSSAKADKLAVHILEEKDIVFGRKGAVDRHLFVKNGQAGWIQGSDCIRLRISTPEINPRFISYAFLRAYHKQWMLNQCGNKATMASLNQDVIRRIEVPLPPRPLQDVIVGILSNYDALIENNRRRIHLLDKAAREVHKEWFVRLQFPGHEHAPVVKGIPTGWVKRKISDFCTVGRGASPRPIKDFLGGEIPWFKIGDATASESPYVFETEEKVIDDGARRSVSLPAGELILSNSATCGVPNFTGVSGCIHDGWLYFKELRVIDKYFLYLDLVHRQRALLQGIGEGATQKNLNTTYVSRQELIVPERGKLLAIFSDFVRPLFEEIYVISRQNIQLTKARDLLLPKLMSGEIAV